MSEASKSKELQLGTVDLKAYALGRRGKSGSFMKALGVTNIRDPFAGKYKSAGAPKILKPPYEPLACSLMMENSTILKQCVDSMSVNVHSFGNDWIEYPKNEDKRENPEAQKEWARLAYLFAYCNPDDDFTTLSTALRDDLEYTGNAYLEIVRNVAGEIGELYLLPSCFTRLAIPDDEFTDYQEHLRDPYGQLVTQVRRRKFRRFIQVLETGGRVWFKEFGDPRNIDMQTGEAGESIPPERLASEVIHFKLRCPYSPYGMPRWVGHLLDIVGNRKVQEINVGFFDNKGVPPLAILVSGGKLSEDSADAVSDIIENEIKGSDNFHKVLVLNALPTSAGGIEGEKLSNVRIDFKPLRNATHADALFSKYYDANTLSLISAWRLPPIAVGRSSDYTKATATMAMLMAENQVFEPERRSYSSRVNRTILADMQIMHWSYEASGGLLQDNAEVLKAIAQVQDKLPLKMIIEQAAEAISKEIPDLSAIPEEFLNTPLGILQQVASMTKDETEELPETVEAYVDQLTATRSKLQKAIKERIPTIDFVE